MAWCRQATSQYQNQCWPRSMSLYGVTVTQCLKKNSNNTHPRPNCNNGLAQPTLIFGQVNTLRPRQNGLRFADDTFKRLFLDENVRISIRISLKFVPNGPINNNPALVQIMAWRRSGDKPLSEPMLVSLLTHICVTRPQWVKWFS